MAEKPDNKKRENATHGKSGILYQALTSDIEPKG